MISINPFTNGRLKSMAEISSKLRTAQLPKKLTIGLIVDDTLDKTDGVQQYVLRVGEWLTSRGHMVYYLAGESGRTDLPNLRSMARNVPVSFNGNRLAIPLPASKELIAELIQDIPFDVLHVMSPHSPFMAQRIITAARDKTAIVGTFHIMPANMFVEYGTWALGKWLKPSLDRIDAMLAVSSVAAEYCKRRFGITAEVVPNAIDTSQFLKATPFEQYADKPTIVYLNRLVKRKGCQYLLEAIKYILDMNMYDRSFRVLICGKGELSKKLQAYVIKHKLDDIVSFTGFVTEEDKPRYLASADIAVYPSTGGESFGIVLLEGMAASNGVVIGGDNPGYASVLEPKTEQLVDATNIPAFADVIVKYLKNPALCEAAAQWQHEHVMQFDIAVVGQKIESVYYDALSTRRSMR